MKLDLVLFSLNNAAGKRILYYEMMSFLKKKRFCEFLENQIGFVLRL